MDVSTVINPDGSGTISVNLSETIENIDFIRRMPNMADYLNTWRDSLRKQGVLIDISQQGENEYVFLQNRFPDSEGISTPIDLPGDITTWIAASKDAASFETTYRYRAVVDTTAFYQAAPGIDPRIQAEVEKQLDQMQFTYSVTLPGEITYSNANRQKGNKLTWDMRMKAKNEIVAESRLRYETRVSAVKSVTGILVGGFALSLFLVIYSVVAYQVRSEGHVRG
jgi:hypothetical protein